LKIEGKSPRGPKKGPNVYGEVGWTRSYALMHYREEGSEEKCRKTGKNMDARV